jgi:hypothetical protein
LQTKQPGGLLNEMVTKQIYFISSASNSARLHGSTFHVKEQTASLLQDL